MTRGLEEERGCRENGNQILSVAHEPQCGVSKFDEDETVIEQIQEEGKTEAAIQTPNRVADLIVSRPPRPQSMPKLCERNTTAGDP